VQRGATRIRTNDKTPLQDISVEPAYPGPVSVAHSSSHDVVHPHEYGVSATLDALYSTVIDMFEATASECGVAIEQVSARFRHAALQYDNAESSKMTQGAAEAPAVSLPSLTSAGLCYSSYVKAITCENPRHREGRVNYLKNQLTAQIGVSCPRFTPRTHHHHLSGMLGVKWRSGRLFPWKTMIMELANAGMVLVNWPENCRHPGQTPRDSYRGISELNAAEQTALMNALVHPEHPLYFLKLVDVVKRKGRFTSPTHLLSVIFTCT
jgi:hypothetical protein